MLGERTAAEDVAEEALARAWTKWSSISGHALAWVVRVAADLAVDQWRRDQRRHRTGEPRLAEHLETVELRLDLQRALSQLPRRQRQVGVLRYFRDLSEADIAAEMGCSAGSVKQHSRRALAGLRRNRNLHRGADEDRGPTVEEATDVSGP